MVDAQKKVKEKWENKLGNNPEKKQREKYKYIYIQYRARNREIARDAKEAKKIIRNDNSPVSFGYEQVPHCVGFLIKWFYV